MCDTPEKTKAQFEIQKKQILELEKKFDKIENKLDELNEKLTNFIVEYGKNHITRQERERILQNIDNLNKRIEKIEVKQAKNEWINSLFYLILGGGISWVVVAILELIRK